MANNKQVLQHKSQSGTHHWNTWECYAVEILPYVTFFWGISVSSTFWAIPLNVHMQASILVQQSPALLKFPGFLLYPVAPVKTKICLHVMNEMLYHTLLICEYAVASNTIVFTISQIISVCFYIPFIIGKSNMDILAVFSVLDPDLLFCHLHILGCWSRPL